MKKLLLSLCLLGLTIQAYAQVTVLPEVVLTANYKYIDALNNEETAEGVKMLREEVALFDLKKSELFVDEYDTYLVSFFIPEGKILAAYDKEGILLRTVERFKNTKLPENVLNSLALRYPKWNIIKDIYKVNYHYEKGVRKQEYRIKLKNHDDIINIKIDANGDFI